MNTLPLSAWEGSPFSERFANSLVAASVLHATQVRKGTSIPYISHLLGTCAIALEYGANEDQAIAALLHDVLEGVEPLEEACAAVAEFGPEVLHIVEGCTDSLTRPKADWRPRKEAYIVRLATEDSAILLVSASDKLHHARSILRDMRASGGAVWTRFSAGEDGQLWYYRALVTAFRSKPEHEPALIDDLDRTVTEIERLAGGVR